MTSTSDSAPAMEDLLNTNILPHKLTIGNKVDAHILNASNKYQNINKNINNKYQNIKEHIHEKPYEEFFEYGVLAAKFGLVGSLIGLSYKNADISFITQDPQKFLSESFAVGASTIIPTLLIAYNRLGGSDKTKLFNACFIAFLLFFLFNVLMEFSGINNSGSVTVLSDVSQQTFLNTYIWKTYNYVLIGLGFVGMMGLAYKIYRSHHPKNTLYNPKINHPDNWANNWQRYVTEYILFGLSSAAPTYLIAKDRGVSTKDATVRTIMMAGAYSSVYLLLQTGGFFKSIFGPMPSTHNDIFSHHYNRIIEKNLRYNPLHM
jgi:hypothetical protein